MGWNHQLVSYWLFPRVENAELLQNEMHQDWSLPKIDNLSLKLPLTPMEI